MSQTRTRPNALPTTQPHDRSHTHGRHATQADCHTPSPKRATKHTQTNPYIHYHSHPCWYCCEGEREKRGSSSKILIKVWKAKFQGTFQNFTRASKTKHSWLNLCLDTLWITVITDLSILKANPIALSGDCECKKITHSGCIDYTDLKSDQEEAETKVTLYTLEALSMSEPKKMWYFVRHPVIPVFLS